jgi:signal transduction histidine kinase
MTPRQPDPHDKEKPLPIYNAVSEYSRGSLFGDTDLSAIHINLALHLASDPDEACDLAVSALSDLTGFGCTIAAYFHRHEDQNRLRGRVASLEDGSTGKIAAARRASLADDIQDYGLDLGEKSDHPMLKAITTAETTTMLVDQDTDLSDVMPSSIVPMTRLLLIPAVGLKGPVGVLAVSTDTDNDGPDEDRMGRLEGIAKHLGLALERISAEQSMRERLSSYETVKDLSRGIFAASNLPDVFHMTAQKATKAVRGGRAFIWVYEESSGQLSLAAQYVARPSDLLDAVLPRFQVLAETCVQQGGRLLYPDLRQDKEMDLDSLPDPLSAIAVPLYVFGEIVGVLAVVDKYSHFTEENDRFNLEEEGLIDFIGGIAAVAIKNSRLYERLGETERRLQETQKTLIESEKMAALGELSAQIARDLRNPLTAIRGYAKRVERQLPPNNAARDDVRVLALEAQRLEEMIGQQLEVSESGAPRLAMRQLNVLVHESIVMLREEMVGRGVFLEETYARDVPELLLDDERVRKVVLNILRNALEVVQDGDTVRIETLREGDRVLLEIANTGEQQPGLVLDELFVPFGTERSSGKGLGLAIANQIIKEHGGEISIRNEGEWGAIFTISFPVRANQERRKLQNRRAGRERRVRGKGRGKDAA